MLPQINESRQTLEDLAPTPAQLLRQLAARTEQLQKETVHAIDQKDPQPPLDKHAAVAYEKLEVVRFKLNGALTALRADAHLQDLLTRKGREIVRDVDDATLVLTHRANQAREAFAVAARQASRLHSGKIWRPPPSESMNWRPPWPKQPTTLTS